MLVVIRGAGDIATGIALRLWRAGIRVVMTDLEKPTAIRRTVAFSQAIVRGEAVVETVTAKRAEAPAQALELLKQETIPVLDCHAVVETMRGHYLGRAIYQGSAQPNTGIPGLIGGFAGERVLRAPADGVFHQFLDIGAQVKMGDIAAEAGGVPMACTLDGVLRGILPEGTPVHKGMKAGDIDPRCSMEHCYCASDKALAVGGGVLEALLCLSGALKSFK